MEIHKFNLLEDKIEVFIWDIEKPVIVDKNDFEDWAVKDGRLDWIYDTSDHKGDHVQDKGTMNTIDYWDSTCYSQKIDDLKDYLKLKK